MNHGIKPAQATLNELRDGQVMIELATAIHEATAATLEFGKEARVTLTITLKPLTEKNLSEPVISAIAEVTTKLPKAEPASTLFFVDQDSNPSRSPTRQTELTGLAIANSK
jgi:hypothetical protein